MTDERRQVDDGLGADDDSRRQLWFRAGVAGGLIALLLGALAVFDHLSKPSGNTEVALPTKPIAPAQVASDAGRDAPPEVIRAGADGAQAEVQEEPPAAEASAPPLLPRDATGTDAPVDRLELPRAGTARPHQAAQPGREAEHRAAARADETPRATVTPSPAAAVPPRSPVAPPAQQASQSPQRDAAPAASVVAPRPTAPASAGAPALAGGPPPALPTPAPAAAQSSSVPAATGTPLRAPVAQVPAPAVEGAGRGYVLQFGFFSSTARAEELKARLAQAGIPAQVETRLVVGPFADRREALAAQARLREKGIDTGVLLPLGR